MDFCVINSTTTTSYWGLITYWPLSKILGVGPMPSSIDAHDKSTRALWALPAL